MRGGQGYAGTAESLPVAHLVRSLGISHYTIGTPTAPRWTHSPSRFGLCSNYPCFSFYGPLLFSFWSTESRTGKTLWYSCSHRRSSLDDKAEDKLSGGARPRGAHHCTLISLFSVASFLFSIALLRNCVSASRRRAGEREQTRTTRRGVLRELEHSRVCQLRVRALPRRSFLQTKRTSAASSLVPWPLYLSLFLLSFSRFLPRFFSFSASPTLSFFAPLLSISLLDPTSHPSISPSTSLSVEREGPPWPPRPSLL